MAKRKKKPAPSRGRRSPGASLLANINDLPRLDRLRYLDQRQRLLWAKQRGPLQENLRLFHLAHASHRLKQALTPRPSQSVQTGTPLKPVIIGKPLMPAKKDFCRVRQERKEVLFANNRAGFSGSAPKLHYIRNITSRRKC